MKPDISHNRVQEAGSANSALVTELYYSGRVVVVCVEDKTVLNVSHCDLHVSM